jgi:CheY-like chemotaxis protein
LTSNRLSATLPEAWETRTPAILLTADDRPGAKTGSLSAGYAVHLTKPVPPDDLAHRVALLVKPPMADS